MFISEAPDPHKKPQPNLRGLPRNNPRQLLLDPMKLNGMKHHKSLRADEMRRIISLIDFTNPIKSWLNVRFIIEDDLLDENIGLYAEIFLIDSDDHTPPGLSRSPAKIDIVCRWVVPSGIDEERFVRFLRDAVLHMLEHELDEAFCYKGKKPFYPH